MSRCLRCNYAFPTDERLPERCPNCGSLTRPRNNERSMSVALGTLWRAPAEPAKQPTPPDSPPAPPAPPAPPDLGRLPTRTATTDVANKASAASKPGRFAPPQRPGAGPGQTLVPRSVLAELENAEPPIVQPPVVQPPAEPPAQPQADAPRPFTIAVSEANADPDADLPAPVASSRPFTLSRVQPPASAPDVAHRVAIDVESSAELDLPAILGTPQRPPHRETIVASPTPAGTTRPDDVDLDLDELYNDPPPPTPAPAPAPTPTPTPTPTPVAADPTPLSASSSGSSRDHGRAPQRPRTLVRTRTSGPDHPPSPLAHASAIALAATLVGLLGVYFFSQPTAASNTPANAHKSNTPSTWSPDYLATVANRLDADRVADYLAAMADAETHGDRLGRAEAALCMHIRYGPDLVRRSAATVWRTQGNPADPRANRIAGLAALADGDLELADRLLQGDDPRTRLYRALTAMARQDGEAAAILAEQALVDRPGDAAAALVSELARLAARRTTPLTGLQVAAERHADHPLFQQARVRALFDRGRLAAARTLADQLGRVEGASAAHQAQIFLLQAEVAAAVGEDSKALWLTEDAGHLAPQHLPTQLERARLLLGLGDLERIQQDLLPLLRDAPDNPQALKLQIEIALRTNNETTAERLLERLAKLPEQSGHAARIRGKLLTMQGKSAAAITAYQAALGEDVSDVAAAVAVAQHRLKAGVDDPLAPITQAERALRADPRAIRRADLRQLASSHATLLAEVGRKDQAIAVLDAALAIDPDDNAAQLRRGVLAIQQGRTTAGRADLMAVFERTGGFPGLAQPLGRLFLREGDLASLASLVQSQAADPYAADDVVVMFALLRLAQGDRDAAERDILRVLQRDPSSWPAHLARAQVLYDRERWTDAHAEIRLAQPPVPDAEVELWTGKIAEKLGKPQDAIAAYRRARTTDPSLLEAGYLLGRTLLAQGLAREAIPELQAVTRAGLADATPAGAYLTLGIALHDRNQLAEAQTAFAQAIQYDPNPAEALYWAGRTASELGQHGEAITQLRRAIASASAAAPWQPEAQFWLGRTLHRLGQRSEARIALRAYLDQAGPKAPARTAAEKMLRER